MRTARVSSLQVTSDDTARCNNNAEKKLNRSSTSKMSLVDMFAYGCKSAGLDHDHRRNSSVYSIPTSESATCFESHGNSTPIVGDQLRVPSIRIRRTGGQTKIGFDGSSDTHPPSDAYAPNQYNTHEESNRRRLFPSEKQLRRHKTETSQTVQAHLQNASDLSRHSSQLVGPGEKNIMNSRLHTPPPHQGYQPQEQSMWVDNKSRPKSKAIAIKRNNRCPEECSASLSEASSERMYDWATWRMYNRIVDHRRNQRQSMRTSLPPLAMDHHANQILPHPDMHADRFESRGAADYIHDGEVFELDF
jgi:hypothetical protein